MRRFSLNGETTSVIEKAYNRYKSLSALLQSEVCRVLYNNQKITIMTEQEIVSKVKAIIVDKLLVEESQVTMEANFQADLNADSLDTVELIMAFEKEFNITIPDEDTQKISTVGDAVAYIKEALA